MHSKRIQHVPQPGAPGVYYNVRRDGSKVFLVRHPAPKFLWETVGTRLDRAKARAREVHAPGAPQVDTVATRLEEVYAQWKTVRVLRPRSAEAFDGQWRTHIEPTLGRKKVRKITAHDIEAWLADLKRKDGRPGPLGEASKLQALRTLLLLLQHGVEMGVIGAVPKLNRTRTPKKPAGRTRILTSDEERTLLAYCGSVPWLQPIIVVALHQALRMGEVLALRWEDVDFAAGTLTVRHTLGRDGTLGPPKGGRVDVIPLTPKARDVLLDLRLERADADGPIFRNGLGGQRALKDVDRAFRNAVRTAGLKDGVVFHALRHTGISRIANHHPAIPLSQVRDFARHSDIATTQLYIHRIDSEAVKTAIGEALAAE